MSGNCWSESYMTIPLAVYLITCRVSISDIRFWHCFIKKATPLSPLILTTHYYFWHSCVALMETIYVDSGEPSYSSTIDVSLHLVAFPPFRRFDRVKAKKRFVWISSNEISRH
ncbi:hypothetical protein PILCRDRAFT_823516 [Piloderma croceum F 1598]|uniref:Uncharacterized protein n=1 Tax=Piloderma croceum (strain F 1598) TaxID=765440 RepID=A0A0C3BPN5_PILCF|nr:hypothetical protein PILCRDRAFT_823516 [Piloderma croceum F 1598]